MERKSVKFLFKKSLIICFIIVYILCIQNVLAVECDGNLNSCDNSNLQLKINCLEEKKNVCSEKGTTLTTEINRFNTQIYLTETRIAATEQNIIKIQNEIDSLGKRIEGLDSSLSYLTELFLEKVIEGYKQRSLSLLDYVFNANNIADFLARVKYLKTTQNNNQKIVVQVQQTKLNSEEQKKLREEKVKELDNLKELLVTQKQDLDVQKSAKQKLLTATQSSEVVYQQLIEKARQELAGFSAFARAAGGGLTTFGNGSNGWYFTQRDPQWGNNNLPGSSYNLATAGCAVTSVAMVCRSYGQGTTPASIAADSSRFIGGDLWNWAFSCDGKGQTWLSSPSQDQIKSYVQNNTPVILRLYAPSVSGLHFIVAYGWDDGKNDFKIHDPYYGPDKLFSSDLQYNWSQVTTAIVIQ